MRYSMVLHLIVACTHTVKLHAVASISLARTHLEGYRHPMSQTPGQTFSPLKRTIALVGLMGAGKSSVGRRLAVQLGVPFKDADDEIVIAAGRPIADIFADRGEDEFRAGERRVIARILDEPPHILATGGGAFMNPVTRVLLRQRATTIWLRADLETLVKRVSRRDDRPLLRDADPRVVMADLMEKRYPIYTEADIIVESREGPHNVTVDAVIAALRQHGDLERNN
jgi:shikimate kinase